jgi:opacity protein-like surface antigen
MRIKLLSAALLASGFATAATPVDGWYTSFFGGYNYFMDNVDIITSGVLRNNVAYKEGYNVGGRIGYQSNPIRYEGEYTYIHGNTDYFSVNGTLQTNVTGYTAGNLYMANVYYDFREILPSVAPFAGVGIGYANIQTTLDSEGPNGVTVFKAVDNEFAYQGTLGLTYNFAENYALNIAYRYTATDRASNFGKVYQAHFGDVGVIYHFDRGFYK